MKFTWKLSIISIFIVCIDGLNNGLGRTPQMGWNSWYNFWCNYTDQMIKSSVDILIDTGLAKLGYNYINLDDCWQISRDENGDIVEDPNVFPNGILPLIAFIHSKGLKFGLYSDAGYKTCAGRPGSLGYETKDALKYAEWEVDYVKYDNCNTDGTKPEVRYPIMRDALNKTGRPMFYSLCEWGVDQPALWATDVGNSWRTTNDIGDTWDSIIDTIDQNNEYADHAGPGGWNDPDMLRLGYEKMDDEEDRSYFSLWSISKSPLIIGTDIRKMSNTTLSIYSNPEVIAINQDPLGVQGKKLKVFSSRLTSNENSLRFSYCSNLKMISSRQRWFYHSKTQLIQSKFNGKCLTRKDSSSSLIIRRCSSNDSNQKWIFNKFDQRLSSLLNKNSFVDLNLSIRTNQSGELQLREFLDEKMKIKRRNYCLTVEQDLEIWSGPVNDKSFAVIFLNRNSMKNETITIEWKDLGWENNRTGLVRDLWSRKDLGTFQTSFTSTPLQLHQIQFVKIQPKD